MIQVEELPECYQTDEPFDLKEQEEIAVGRGARKRNAVGYSDGLDDDTWAMVRWLSSFSSFGLMTGRLSRRVKIFQS